MILFLCESNRFAWVALATLLLLLLLFFVHGFAGVDDTHITYSAAFQLVEHGRIYSHSTDAVEQSSSLLQVLILAATYSLTGFSLVTLGPLLSLFFSVSTFFMAGVLAKRVGVRSYNVVILLLASSLAFNYWSIVGLETSLVAFIITLYAWVLIQFFENKNRVGLFSLVLVSALLILVRPEAVFVVATIVFCLLCASWMRGWSISVGSLVVIMQVTLGIFSVLCVYRVGFYDQWFPQPVYAKSGGFNPLKYLAGLAYFVVSLQLSVVLCSLLIARGAKRLFFNKDDFSIGELVLMSISGAYLVFIIVSGGDWMGAGRFFAPIMPLLLCWFMLQIQHLRLANVFIVSMLVLLLSESLYFGAKQGKGFTLLDKAWVMEKYPAKTVVDNYSMFEWLSEPHLRDIPLIEHLKLIVAGANREQLSLMSVQMGMVPYHLLKEYGASLSFIDMRGLTSKDITACDGFNRIALNGGGTLVKYSEYFGALEKGLCNLREPDIIYDLLSDSSDKNRLDAILNQGFKLVYIQRGSLKDRVGDKRFNIDAFIAVSPEVFNTLPESLRLKHVVEW